MTAPTAEVPAATTPAAAVPRGAVQAPPLPTYRVNIMRIGYLVMVVGLAFVKWPLFFQNGGIGSLPVFEGVVAALLTAMSLIALVGLRYPVQLVPLLVFESLWKVIWLATVGVPHAQAGDMDAQMSSVFSSVALIVIILAVTPWDYVWKRYVSAPGEPWR